MAEYIIDQDVESGVISEETQYGGFWIRFAAFLIDGLVLIPISGLVIVNTWLLKSLPLHIVVILLSVVYKPLLEFKYGATVGKMAVKIKVVTQDLQKITFSQAAIRYIPWLVGSLISLFSAAILFADQAFLEDKTYMGSMQAQAAAVPQYISFIGSIVLLIVGLSILFNKQKRGLHDIMAGTVVIKKQEV